MKTLYLYDQSQLPTNFKFPSLFLSIMKDFNTHSLEPWKFLFLSKSESIVYLESMRLIYKDKPLIPFAILEDPSGLLCDGYVTIACFDGDDKSGDPRIYFHDYSSNKKANWDNRYFLINFSEWLRVAKEESEKFKLDLND